MSHGERKSMLANHTGKEYWKKRGFSKKAGWQKSISNRAGQNKLTKRFTNKSERMQVKNYLNQEKNNV